MEVILLERIETLGKIGDVVKVKPGFARNFLLPQKKALRATKANLEYFETQRSHLEALNAARLKEASGSAGAIDNITVTLIRQASETGQLYGSVTARDIANTVSSEAQKVERRMIQLNHPIKALGLHPVRIALHPEVIVTVTVNVARSEEEAKLQIEHGGAIVKTEAPPAETEGAGDGVAEVPPEAAATAEAAPAS
ncbi:MAG TPA: 50S ribosomal protein L9 [Alphaproteobacteria bacterium]|nr:50S ribosomal protein L9 [Alphaproteobacteria bacterium]